ncbi:MAG: T9SS type A sorting domain-containing protein [Bacteroidetes bacterium]|nr:T9SS type A sorting domain-containing protein [Bacteroidota bacterium]
MKLVSLCIRLLFVSALLFIIDPVKVSGQHQAGGVPLSFGRALDPVNIKSTDIPGPSAECIRQNETVHSLPYRFALNLPVDISMSNSGSTEILKDGQRVWRLTVHSAGAKALILYFNRFSIPEGGKLFVYNPSRTQMFGAYTSANKNSFGTFACPLVEGDALVMEYNAPSGLAQPDIHISEVAYAFRGFTNYEENNPLPSSGTCEVNVNCTEGDNWQKQKRGVVKLVIKDSLGHTLLCSGSMINNTNNDGIPYLLTANHCGRYARPIDLSQWLFYFNYEMPGCPNTIPLTPSTLLGASMKSHGGTEFTGSDFYLVRLSESVPDSLHVYFNGWNRETASSPSGTGIHHPGGDVKKISTYNSHLITSSYPGNPLPCFWAVYWNYTVHGHGVTERGSSGSPIFNSDGQIVGTLTGGDSSCDTAWINSSDYYGKFSWHWDLNGSDSVNVLKYWLDPNNTGVTKMGGWALGIDDQAVKEGIKLFPNPAHENTTISLENESSDKGVSDVSITDILGNRFPHWNFTENIPGNYTIDLQSLLPGVYIVFISGRNFTKSIKLVKI